MPEKAIFKYVTAYAGLAPAVDLSSHTLLFTHVPKTAGTTLDYILRAVALTQQIPFLRAMGTIYGQFHGVGKGDPMREFARWPDSALAQRAYVSGHLPYGVHQRLSRPYFYITVLRDPLPRLLSQYRFGIQRGGWYETSTIAQVMEKGQMADNLQTRQLAGITDRATPVTAETLKTAIEHLRAEYTVVGTSERFDDTLKLLITVLGWPDVAYGNRQVTAGASSPQLMLQAQEAAQRFFGYDLELYAVAKELAKENAAKVLKGSPQGSARQGRVVVCIPGTPMDGKEEALMSAENFDREFRPALQAQGGDIQFV
jgi:hypothetical protein